MRNPIAVLPIVLIVTACSAPMSGDPPAPMTQDQVQSFFDRYAELWMAGDIDGWLALWVDSAEIVQMPPNEPRVVGMADLRTRNAAAISAATYSNVIISNLDVRSDGDIAIASGVYTMDIAPKDGSDPWKLDAKYMSVFERQEDATWKLIRDAFSPNGG